MEERDNHGGRSGPLQDLTLISRQVFVVWCTSEGRGEEQEDEDEEKLEKLSGRGERVHGRRRGDREVEEEKWRQVKEFGKVVQR